MSDKTLERIRARMSKHKAQSGSDAYWKPDPDTKHTIRILPPVGNMDAFWQEVGRHYFEGRATVLCPNFTTDGAEECILCSTARELNMTGDPADKAAARELFVRRSYQMNIIIRDKNAEVGFIGPKVYTPGVTVFENMYAIVADEDYGAIWDPKAGFDIRLTRHGSGLDTTYQVMPRPKTTALLNDTEAVDKLLSEASDLSVILNSLPTEEQLLEAAGLGDDEDGFDDDDFDDDDFDDDDLE